MYGYACYRCNGTVEERRRDREIFQYNESFVALEDAPVGICATCGARYFDASLLRRVAEVGRGDKRSQRTLEVPVERYALY